MSELIPVWVAVVTGAVPTLSASAWLLYKLYRRIRDTQRAAGRKEGQEQIDDYKAARRDAMTEAKDDFDRMAAKIDELEAKVDTIEAKERACMELLAVKTADHRETKTMLRVLVGWALKQKNPPFIPQYILDKLDNDDTGPHTPLRGYKPDG